MTPAPGERRQLFVGDRIRFTLRPAGDGPPPKGWRARLRTNLGRADQQREEIVRSHFQKLPLAGASWRDIEMQAENGEWVLDLPLTEVGFFQAKAYAIDANNRQHWPSGDDFGLSVNPDDCRSGNSIYCAFPRMFGATKSRASTADKNADPAIKRLDDEGYTVIPPSGTLRDLKAQLPHILDELGCRILLLLPVNSTPTVMARFGRYGSPYACQDLTDVDPALIDFDKRTTGVEQFVELATAVHAKGAKLFIDLVINHTGWGSTLHENHPEWFGRTPEGEFESPGAWGVVWEDLVELDQRFPELWDELAEVFLTWCRRGVDGFRCDAGYKVPTHVWQYITAKVRREFPNAVFFLEGLGGSWEATDSLLTHGGMQWAYSELFQEYSGDSVQRYLDRALPHSDRVGTFVHFSETHDNLRLAAQGRDWSLLRNRLCALTSVSGGFGFACGVEWLAAERINVHSSRGMSWGDERNIIPELRTLIRLVNNHPCFFDGARLERLSSDGSAVYALKRTSADGFDTVLVLANTDMENKATVSVPADALRGAKPVDLLGQDLPEMAGNQDRLKLTLKPGACLCLAAGETIAGLSGEDYRQTRARAAWALRAIWGVVRASDIGPFDWRELSKIVDADPAAFLATIRRLKPEESRSDLLAALRGAMAEAGFANVVEWSPADSNRITVVPRWHWLLVVGGEAPFRARLGFVDGSRPIVSDSVLADGRHVAAFSPANISADAELSIRFHDDQASEARGGVRFVNWGEIARSSVYSGESVALLTNGRGAMARMCADLGRVNSKYDCVLGANLHPTLPVDRHVFVKRMRAWVNADGFIAPLNGDNLVGFQNDGVARWRFVAGAGDGRAVELRLEARMVDGENTTLLRLSRPAHQPSIGRELPDECEVGLTLRFDIEDRNFHSQTKRNDGADHHFSSRTRTLQKGVGFVFAPAEGRELMVSSDAGVFHMEPEWSTGIPHPVEQTRGQEGHGDGYSPGWFELPLGKGEAVTLVVTAEAERGVHSASTLDGQGTGESGQVSGKVVDDGGVSGGAFEQTLRRAVEAFVVKRDDGRTVIAGYPWFLDWGRDTLIAARGMLAAGMRDEVAEILTTFGRYEENGTLPNTIHGSDVSNRDTSDAPLWYGVVCEEFAKLDEGIYDREVDGEGRTIRDVLRSIADGYSKGTPNGIRMDAESGLIWSPSHFTWMDTNYPAGTPREGYPIEIQAMWIRLLRQLDRLKVPAPKGRAWGRLAKLASASFESRFWIEDKGWFADQLIAAPGISAAEATRDNAVRSNCLLAISLGLGVGEKARRCVEAARRHLVVPGALRSLAPLPVEPPLAIVGNHGQPLNDPAHPYWGRYEGDEDTRRKPAYHNGTAWTWTFPSFCEALVEAYRDDSSAATVAARDYLFSARRLMDEGCLGHLPEILDGDAPHWQRGCDAQAWGATEVLRVWLKLGGNWDPNADGYR